MRKDAIKKFNEPARPQNRYRSHVIDLRRPVRFDPVDFELLEPPQIRLGMRRSPNKSNDDRTYPMHSYRHLVRFLDKGVGRRWTDVYSEFCNVVDVRSPLGRQFHSELVWYVSAPKKLQDPNSESQYTRFAHYLVDGDGVLQFGRMHFNGAVYRHKFPPTLPRFQTVVVNEGVALIKYEGLWWWCDTRPFHDFFVDVPPEDCVFPLPEPLHRWRQWKQYFGGAFVPVAKRSANKSLIKKYVEQPKEQHA